MSETEEEIILFDAASYGFLRVNFKDKRTYWRVGTVDEWRPIYEITGTE